MAFRFQHIIISTKSAAKMSVYPAPLVSQGMPPSTPRLLQDTTGH